MELIVMSIKSIALAVVLIATTGPAFAICDESIGCTDTDHFSKSDLRQLSCENLWVLRNTIYQENGYCFKTQRAINYLGNDQCSITNMSAVPLSQIERFNIGQIVAVERQMGCS
jgi:hypothetical protein